MKAIWNNEIIADSSDTLVIEGNHYFPQDTVNLEYLVSNDNCVECPWKGLAKYYNLQVDGKNNPNAAWFYPNPKEAILITGYIAFRNDIQITE